MTPGQFVKELAALGYGVRDTARILKIPPSNVCYHRDRFGIATIPKKTDEDLIAELPDALAKRVLKFRESRK